MSLVTILNGLFIRQSKLRKLGEDIVQVVRVGIPAPVLRRPELGLVSNVFVPDDDVS